MSTSPADRARKNRARSAVHVAVKTGRLRRQPCEACGAQDVHAHHDDYARPLDVRWLCPPHHRVIHGQVGGVALTTNVKVRMDDDMRVMLERLAAAEDRTVGAIVRRAIRAYVATTNGKQPDATEDAA